MNLNSRSSVICAIGGSVACEHLNHAPRNDTYICSLSLIELYFAEVKKCEEKTLSCVM